MKKELEDEFDAIFTNLTEQEKIKLADLVLRLEALELERANIEIEVMDLINQDV